MAGNLRNDQIFQDRWACRIRWNFVKPSSRNIEISIILSAEFRISGAGIPRIRGIFLSASQTLSAGLWQATHFSAPKYFVAEKVSVWEKQFA